MRKRYVLFICVAISASLLLISLDLLQAARRTAQDMDCQNHMTLLAQSMYRYHDKYGHFPPSYVKLTDGTPAHSWRVLLLEFIDEDSFKKYNFQEPWNSKHNRSIESNMPRFYQCPSSANYGKSYETNYFLITGRNTMFPGNDTTAISAIKKGQPGTMMIVESTALQIHWMRPDDIPYETLIENGFPRLLASSHSKGANICMSNGEKVKLESLEQSLLPALPLVDK